MDALDLTQCPPRSSRATIGGIAVPFLARTVDKLRATLPGGDLGAYQVEGFSARLLETLGIDEAALRDRVARAANDNEVADWVRPQVTREKLAAATEALESLCVRDRIHREGWLDRYPLAANLPLDAKVIDMLDKDDAASFAST